MVVDTQWKPSETNPRMLVRSLHTVEEHLHQIRVAAGDQGGILISSRITLKLTKNNSKEDELISKLTKAWIALRAKYPILGVQVQDKGHAYGYPLLNEEEIKQWSKQSTSIYHLSSPFNQDQVNLFRDQESHRHLPDVNGNEVQMWFILPKDKVYADEVVISIRINHTLVDGDAVPILLDEYLHLLNDTSLPEYKALWEDDNFQKQLQKRLPAYLGDTQFKFIGKDQEYPLHDYILTNSAKHMKFNPCSNEISVKPNKSRHNRIIFTESESKALVNFAKSNQTTVTPILSAIIQLRLALNYSSEWPISKDTTHSDIFPVNIRPALKDSRRVGMALAIHGSKMSTGKVLSSLSKEQVEVEFKELVVKLAEEVKSSYHDCKDPQFRADLHSNVDKLYEKWNNGVETGLYNRKQVTSIFYSDGKQDVYFTPIKENSSSNIAFDVIDYDLDVHYTEPVFAFRARVFQGKTSLQVNWCDAFWRKDEGDKVLNLIRQDVLKIIS